MDEHGTLSERMLEHLSKAVKTILHPSFYAHTLREVGVSLGREIASHIRRSHAPASSVKPEDYLHCLERMRTHWQWNHEVTATRKNQISVSIAHCPFGALVVDNPQICQIEAGILGGIAGDYFNYGKVQVCRGPGAPPHDCRLTVYFQQTAQSILVEGPNFPLTHLTANVPHAVSCDTQALSNLSPRERQILKLIGEGLSDKESALALDLSVRTVEGHTARIRAKTGLVTRRDLIRLALRFDAP